MPHTNVPFAPCVLVRVWYTLHTRGVDVNVRGDFHLT